MKIKLIRSNLIEALKSVQNIVGGKGTLPILQNVMLETKGNLLKLTTTDLDTSIIATCACDVTSDGRSTLPVKYLFSAISTVVEGEVEIEIDGQEHATITAGNAKFKLAGLPASEFPKLPQDENAYGYVIPQGTLKEMLRKVSYAASQDDTRRTLKGVLMSFKNSKLTMVATDGRRLALVENEIEFPKDAEKDIVLPSKAVSELQRSLNGDGNVEVSVQKTQICFKMNDIVMFSKLIEENYPNYMQVIPKENGEEIIVDRQLLLDALGRASVMTMDEAHSTKLRFESGRLTVSSATTDIGEAKDEVSIKYAGETIEIIFNPNYVMDPLKAIDDDEVKICLRDGHSPAVIRCSIPFLYVLMPLRLS